MSFKPCPGPQADLFNSAIAAPMWGGMTEVIDTAAWTGRDWENKLLLGCGLLARPTRVLWIRRSREHPKGKRVLLWGVEVGYNLEMDWWAIEFYWGSRRWAPLVITSNQVFEYRSRKAWK